MKADFTIKVVQAWWLTPYFYTLAAFCALTGCEVDEKKLLRIIDRALKPKIVWK
ncbi:hypothetical protein HHL21_12145 [Massilia sp. RP-1-19]|uniref:Uncharacterized protein n=1 Tax=Massilia polaris TaxID=2728846 RepID=A0A848HPT1_9BURK|nr:hypothetical protein [Massilia polaris]NML61811.1 hypothetical protein [Massilia polaris]